MILPNAIPWAAGLFEGEGWISIRKQSHNNGNAVRLGIQMTDLDVLQKFVAAIGIAKTPYERKRQPNRKPIWCLEVNRREDVIRVLTQFMPYFGTRRREKAIEAMDQLNKYKFYYRGERGW